MFTINDWETGLVEPVGQDSIGLEAMHDFVMGPGDTTPPGYFKTVNIAAENGRFYVTIYVCDTFDGSKLAQGLSIWLSGLRETDEILLTISSLMINPPLGALIALMSALTSTKAHLTIQFDQVVVDNLAYFYLIPDEIQKGSEGALYIPSYIDQREQDLSGPTRAIHDFYKWVVDAAVTKNLLTADEASALHRGGHVVIPRDRF